MRHTTLPVRAALVAAFSLSALIAPILQGQIAPEVVANLRNAVVVVDTDEHFGTGFIVSPDGLILTNAHVADEASLIITFADGRREMARFVGFERDGHDLAALRLESGRSEHYLRLAEPSAVEIGQPIFVVGNPFPIFPATLSGGFIANHSERYQLLLVDAPISSGSSGSPVVNPQGLVVGIATSQLLDSTDPSGVSSYSSGFNTALDRNRIAQFLTDLEAGRVTSIRQANFEWMSLPLPHLQPPQRIDGTLHSQSDRLLQDRSFVDGYTLDLATDQTVIIEMSSSEVDAYLMLHDPWGRMVLENDDANPNTTDAKLVYRSERGGRYSILANTYASDETGPYNLSVRLLTFGEPTVISGHLTTERGESDELDWFQSIDGRRGQTVSILMTSEEVDSYLELLNASGQVIDANDDHSEGTFDARIIHTFEDEGTYQIRATSFGRQDAGAFSLHIAWEE